MDTLTHAGATVLVAFAGSVPLSLLLRRRPAARDASPRTTARAWAALLVAGVAASGLQATGSNQ